MTVLCEGSGSKRVRGVGFGTLLGLLNFYNLLA